MLQLSTVSLLNDPVFVSVDCLHWRFAPCSSSICSIKVSGISDLLPLSLCLPAD